MGATASQTPPTPAPAPPPAPRYRPPPRTYEPKPRHCQECGGELGDMARDWAGRKYHKKCWYALKAAKQAADAAADQPPPTYTARSSPMTIPGVATTYALTDAPAHTNAHADTHAPTRALTLKPAATLADRFFEMFELYATKRAIALKNAKVLRATQPSTAQDEAILWRTLIDIVVWLPALTYADATKLTRCTDYADDFTVNADAIRELCACVNAYPADVRASLGMHVRAITGTPDIYSAATPTEVCYVYAWRIVGQCLLRTANADLDNFLMADLVPLEGRRLGQPSFQLATYVNYVLGTWRNNRDKLVAITAYVLERHPEPHF